MALLETHRQMKMLWVIVLIGAILCINTVTSATILSPTEVNMTAYLGSDMTTIGNINLTKDQNWSSFFDIINTTGSASCPTGSWALIPDNTEKIILKFASLPANATNLYLKIKLNSSDFCGYTPAGEIFNDGPMINVRLNNGSWVNFTLSNGYWAGGYGNWSLGISSSIFYFLNTATTPFYLGYTADDYFLFTGNGGIAKLYEIWLEYDTDNIPPQLSVNFTNNSKINSTSPSRSYPFSINNSDTGDISSCFYSLNNGANNTYSCSDGSYSTATVTNIPTGTNNIRFHVQDTAGAITSSPLYTFTFFMYGFKENSQTYNNLTLENSEETFLINATYDSNYYSSAIAFLIYNGTTYTGTKTGTGDTVTFSASLLTPPVSTDTNKTFYWTIGLYNGTGTEYYNSTSKNQTIKNLGIDDCSVNTIVLLNYTLFDEDDTLIKLISPTINNSFEINLRLGSFDKSQYINISFNKTNANPVRVCISSGLLNQTRYRLDATVKYSSTDRVVEYHNIQNFTILNSSLPQNIYLYDLLTTSSQEFLISFKSINYVPQENVLIEIVRRYVGLGSSFTVEAPVTDVDGRTIGHFVLNDVVYDIYAKKDGNIIATFNNIRVFCSNIATGDCRLNLNVGGSTLNPESFYDRFGVSYITSYNDTTRLFSFIFSTIDSTTKNFNLTIERFDNYGNYTLCSSAVTTSSGILQCDLSSYGNITAYAKMFVNGELLTTATFRISASTSSPYNKSNLKFLLAFFLILTFPFIALTSAPMMVVTFIIGLIVAVSLGLIEGGGYFGSLSAVLWFIIAGLILLWKMTRGRNRP
jgi:hypothetical protein